MSERSAFPGIDLRGSVAIVTGAGSGIGKETALSLADMGADVAVLDVDGPAAERTSGEILGAGRRSVAQQVDVSSETGMRSAFEASREALGDADIAVACAGILGDYQGIDVTSVEHF